MLQKPGIGARWGSTLLPFRFPRGFSVSGRRISRARGLFGQGGRGGRGPGLGGGGGPLPTASSGFLILVGKSEGEGRLVRGWLIAERLEFSRHCSSNE